MSRLLLLPPPPTEEEVFPESAPPLNIVVLFADVVMARRSLRIYNDLIDQFAPDCVFNASWWQFDRLQRPEWSEAASHAAAEADIVMVAAHADDALPDVVKAWMHMTLGQSAKPDRLLIGLLGATTTLDRGESPVDRYLQTAAQEAGMEYLLHWSAFPSRMSNGSLEDIASRAQAVTPVLAEILAHPMAIPHGGIND